MATTFAPVKRESTREKVYGALREAILSGKLKTGQRLVEIPLAKELGVSRAVLREALQQLGHEGLVDQNGYKGTRVVRLTPEQVDEIVGARLLLEIEAVRLAHSRLTAQDKRELRSLAREMAAETDFAGFSQLDLALHQRIWRASGNGTIARLLLQVSAPLFAMSLLMRSAENRTRTRKDQKRGDHTPLVEAICAGTQEEAVEAMRFHLTENWTAIRARLETFLAEESE
jgi:DNA-binding GntR family transcriptional regulator